MGLINKLEIKKENQSSTPATQEQNFENTTALSFDQNYHDHDVELDSIERLKANIFMLSDLERRLAFMNKELESVLSSKKRS